MPRLAGPGSRAYLPSDAPGEDVKDERPNPDGAHVDALRAAGRLAVEATRGVTEVVAELHRTIASGPAILGKPFEGPARAWTGLVYGTIRGVTGMVGAGIDAALAQLGPLLGESVPGPQRDAVLAALNGVLGDYLSETDNPLAIPMKLRSKGESLPLEAEALRARLPDASGRVVVLVHGSSMTDSQWSRRGHDHGAALARDLGYTPIYLRYNSGRHISTNGRELAALLEQLIAAWPVPLETMALVGHSMGGLVCRSACLAAEAEGLRWRQELRKLACLGSPHHGAPLERGGNGLHILLGVSDYSAPFARLARLRSAGITDLRFGNVLEEHWAGRDRFAWGSDARRSLALPAGVDCYAIAATPALERAEALPGDGLVPVDSALGRHPKPELTLPFPEAHQWIALGARHLDLLDRAEVYEKLRSWLSPPGS